VNNPDPPKNCRIGFLLDENLDERLRTYCFKTRNTKTAVIIRSIREFLDRQENAEKHDRTGK